MIDYATVEEKCRSRMLLHYFGEKNEHNCGQCDACLMKHESGIKLGDFQELKEQILELLKERPLSSVELCDKLKAPSTQIVPVVSFLISEEIIYLRNGILSV